MKESIDITNWHHAYRSASGEEVTLNFYRESMWREFIRYMNQNRPDFTMDDLKSVIALRKQRQKDKAHDFQSVKFDKIVGCPDHVEQDIGEARSKSRQIKPQKDRQSVLKAVGYADKPTEHCKPIAEVLADLQSWKQENGMV